MLPEETPPRPQLDSGQIDLIAMDREAREAMQKMEQEALAKKAPPTPPSTAPWAVESSLDDDAEFARSLASPWQRIPRVKLIAGAAGAFVLLLVIGIFASSGGSDDAKKTTAALPAPPEPTVTALPSSIPPPPAATPEPAATTATVAAKPPTTTPNTIADAKPHNDKPRKPSRRVKPSGPKLQKVQSSGT